MMSFCHVFENVRVLLPFKVNVTSNSYEFWSYEVLNLWGFYYVLTLT